jgi:hypothetical protein
MALNLGNLDNIEKSALEAALACDLKWWMKSGRWSCCPPNWLEPMESVVSCQEPV